MGQFESRDDNGTIRAQSSVLAMNGGKETVLVCEEFMGNNKGESGYIRMKCDTKDNDDACGIAMQASYPVQH